MSISNQMGEAGYLTYTAAGEVASVSYHTVRKWALSGKVDSVEKAGKRYISAASLEEFLREK